MIKLGMLLEERYEIIEKIGTGGMSDVYRAKDHKLNRFVAVKVLKQEFSENANFVSKFIVEAQAAAGLMHPNIVNVYDVGEEAGIHYIIMELVEGITLKKYIEKKARLSFKEAVSIAIQVSMGIEAAHNNHIIHRDIKPQNIIISKEGKVKVTDFGIAKAATSNTVTSNVMGSVHYTSPEQARGGYSDEKSDVYSLGITLFEMLTGRVPFDGETTVAIAIKHIQEPMPSPREYISEIPISVEQIVLKCCQKAVDRRYQSMGALIEDLKQALLNPDEDFVQMVDPEESGATRMINANGWIDEYEENHRTRTGQVSSPTGSLKLRTDRIPEELLEKEEEVEAQEGRVERVTTIVMAVIGVLIICMIIFLASKIFGFFDAPGNNSAYTDSNSESNITTESLIETGTISSIEMISVIGEKEQKMVPILRAKGLEVQIYEEESMEYEAGVILACDVEAGTILKEGDVVAITVSTGAGAIEIENVAGKSYEEAKAILEQQGFIVNKSESYTNEVAKGYVISQNPEGGRKVTKGTAVALVVSLGEDKVRVPYVMGMSLDMAKAELTAAGINVGTVEEAFNDTVEAGRVCYQSYPVGSYIEKNVSVNLQISKGAKPSTYYFKGEIAAPTATEAPEYKNGDVVDVSLVTEDGKILLSTSTSTFPISADYSGMVVSKGTVTMTYYYEVVVTPATETTPAVTEKRSKSFTREVTFLEE
ncbi:MAG: Stk1 family PASTA domain-containing Ser/Thr kinase [Lachnospiraceae bacterium]|nr:Stk1 family PASTA domain-containing Ser/Thr kinase [Lachnospiraceae bacterium]